MQIQTIGLFVFAFAATLAWWTFLVVYPACRDVSKGAPVVFAKGQQVTVVVWAFGLLFFGDFWFLVMPFPWLVPIAAVISAQTSPGLAAVLWLPAIVSVFSAVGTGLGAALWWPSRRYIVVLSGSVALVVLVWSAEVVSRHLMEVARSEMGGTCLERRSFLSSLQSARSTGPTFDRHAVMLVEDRWLQWSYRQAAFLPVPGYSGSSETTVGEFRRCRARIPRDG